MKTEHVKTTLYQCEKCPETFWSKLQLRTHVHKNHPISSKIKGDFKCDICGLKLSFYASLQRHKKSMHVDENHYCDICNKKCISKIQLHHHVKACHSSVDCDICQKTIRNAHDLRRHKAIVHNESAYFCNFCPKKRLFLTQDKYEKHLQEDH